MNVFGRVSVSIRKNWYITIPARNERGLNYSLTDDFFLHTCSTSNHVLLLDISTQQLQIFRTTCIFLQKI